MNIRVVPPEVLESMLATDEADEGKAPPRRTPAKAAADGEEDEDLLSRADLKAVSNRLARKAARKTQAAARGAK